MARSKIARMVRGLFLCGIRWRRKGISLRLLRAAVEYARMAGAKIVEGYPADPGARHQLQMARFRRSGKPASAMSPRRAAEMPPGVAAGSASCRMSSDNQ